jgi:hypothetical protein
LREAILSKLIYISFKWLTEIGLGRSIMEHRAPLDADALKARQMKDKSSETSRFETACLAVDVAVLLSLIRYLSYLVGSVWVAQTSSIQTSIWPWIFVAAKLPDYGMTILYFVIVELLLTMNQVSPIIECTWRILVRLSKRRASSPSLRLQGDLFPYVDVIIPTCGEDLEIILDTINAACFMDYPANKFRIVVSDDKSDKTLRTKIYELSRRHTNVFYHARKKSSRHHHGFKAGNINAAVQFTRALSRECSTWIAVLDADMIPEKDFLRALLAHGIRENIGMVSLSQVFFLP